MTKQDRYQLIRDIQDDRGTYLISYVTLTRSGLETPMAMDSIRIIYEHLRRIVTMKEETRIDLFLHSNGGDGTVPWRLVTLIREHCDEFNVIVPHRAFSAATLTALGANSIIIHPMGMLGPTDPTVRNEYNPPNPRNPNELLGISVEDVTAFISLIKDDVGIHHEDELVQAFNILANKVHPLALGNVKRFHSQSRMLAKKLLYLHKDSDKDSHKVNELVDNLTSKLFFHGHPINRYEAKELGLNVEIPSKEVENLIWRLYCEYEKEMKLNQKFSHIEEFILNNPDLKPNETVVYKMPKIKAAYIESNGNTDVNTIDFQVIGTKKPNGITEAQLATLREGWETE